MAEAGKKILQGRDLQDYLERCQRYWTDYKEQLEWDEPSAEGIGLEDCRAALVEQMQEFCFIAQTPDELNQLYWLWADLGQVEAAWALLKSQQEATLAPFAAGFERTQWCMRLNLCELDALWQLDRKAGLSRLDDLCQALTALPEPAEMEHKQTLYDFTLRLEHWSLQWQDWPNYQRILQQQYALQGNIAQYHDRRWVNKTVDLTLDYARYAHHGDDKAALDRYLHQAIEQAGAAGDEVQHEHWMNLCQALFKLNHETIPKALHACKIQLERTENPPAHPAHWAERRVLAARWQARVKAAQGEVDEMLKWAEQGHFKLTSDGDYDSFGNERLNWLLQAGRLGQAGELALSALLSRRRPLAERAWQRALEQVDVNPLPCWHWILFFGQIDPVLQKELGCAQTPAPLPSFSHLQQAEQLAAGSAMTSLLLGRYYALQRDWQQALPRLEYAAFALPQYADDEHIGLLWVARFMQLTDQQLSLCNIPPCEGGDWCLDVGLALRSHDGLLAKHCTDARLQSAYWTRLHIARQYYQGCAQNLALQGEDG